MNSLSLEKFEELIKQLHTIVDLRDPDLFANGFIPGSVNLKLNSNFQDRAKYFLQKDQAIILVADENNEEKSIEFLKNLKYSNIKGYLKNGISTWILNEKPIDLVIAIDAEELALEIKYGDLIYYDIRSNDDYKNSHIYKSSNFSTDELILDTDLIDDLKTTCIYDYDGCLSMSLISYLKTHRKHNLYHVKGGFNAIRENSEIELALK
jgi:hydroxyacylglutathione hydrolase